jgi:hypothetical protein
LGKACCGWLGRHLRVVRSVIVTEAATALFIVATLILPLGPVLILLPLLGVVLNGTSSVLYGTVPELARKGETSRAFALFYTGVIGAGDQRRSLMARLRIIPAERLASLRRPSRRLPLSPWFLPWALFYLKHEPSGPGR